MILLGDCVERLKELDANSVHAVITDPPFAFSGGISNGRVSQVEVEPYVFWFAEVFRQLIRISAPGAPWFFWADWRAIAVYQEALAKACEYYEPRWISQVLIHDREMIGLGNPFRNQTDWIAFIRDKHTKIRDRVGKSQPNIIRDYWYYGKHPNHPAEKSIKVAAQLVRWATDEGQTVCDPFAGSGSTGCASRLGRAGAISPCRAGASGPALGYPTSFRAKPATRLYSSERRASSSRLM